MLEIGGQITDVQHGTGTERYRPLDRCEARIIGTADRAVITVNSQSSRRRQTTG